LNFIFGELRPRIATKNQWTCISWWCRAAQRVMGLALGREHVTMVDLPTLVAIAVSAKVISGVLLIYAWVTNRDTPALALWAIGFLLGAAATALIVIQERIGGVRPIDIADALLILAYGVMWMGARSFNNRKTRVIYLLIVPVVWFLVRRLEIWDFSDSTRIALVSSMLLCYLGLIGFEFWRSNRTLPSRRPLIVIIWVQAAVLLSRLLWPGWDLRAYTERSPAISSAEPIFFELLFQTVVGAFLLAFLMKERREEYHRRASFVDSLTGIWNRRAFLEYAPRRLSRAAIDKQAVALIAFDLDHFKFINDTYGHLGGDLTLCSFCKIVTDALRPNDLFARIGGEEFACLLVDVSPADAVAIAERVRCRFANLEIYSGQSLLRATVSSGLAMAGQLQPDLEALMSAADRALYRAKELGRNRVELEKTAARDANGVRNSDAVR
jgi:diguanylate cyclase (GGDEF)-like protein